MTFTLSAVSPCSDDRLIGSDCQRIAQSERVIVGRPVDDFKLLLCHGVRYWNDCSDQIRQSPESQIYSATRLSPGIELRYGSATIMPGEHNSETENSIFLRDKTGNDVCSRDNTVNTSSQR